MGKVIIISGKKQSGKSTLAKGILIHRMNKIEGCKRFGLIDGYLPDEVNIVDHISGKIYNTDVPSEDTKEDLYERYGAKIYSFADVLKEIAITVLGLSVEQVYGTNEHKNTKTHISWDDMFEEIRDNWKRPKRGSGGIHPASGNMTSREVMQVLGTEIFRKIDYNCWARGTFNKIKNEGYELALCSDARFPNEVSMGTEMGGKAIRLLRNLYNENHESETALDGFPLGEFSLVVDNTTMSIEECHNHVIQKAESSHWI